MRWGLCWRGMRMGADVMGTDVAHFGYTGHYVHKPSGLHLAMYRAYDAHLGRWLNRDPIGEVGGINRHGRNRFILLALVHVRFWFSAPPPRYPSRRVSPRVAKAVAH